MKLEALVFLELGLRGQGCDLDVGLPSGHLLWGWGRQAARSWPPRSGHGLGVGQCERGPSTDTPVTPAALAQPTACVCVANLLVFF